MKDHVVHPDVRVHRVNYRSQGPAIGFMDPHNGKMVMLHADGRFWGAFQLDRDISSAFEPRPTVIVQEGEL
jgi:hypothetical protein